MVCERGLRRVDVASLVGGVAESHDGHLFAVHAMNGPRGWPLVECIGGLGDGSVIEVPASVVGCWSRVA